MCLQFCSVPRRSLRSAEIPGRQHRVPSEPAAPLLPSEPGWCPLPALGAPCAPSPGAATATRVQGPARASRAGPGAPRALGQGRALGGSRQGTAQPSRVPPLEGSGLGTGGLCPPAVTSPCEPGTRCCGPCRSVRAASAHRTEPSAGHGVLSPQIPPDSAQPGADTAWHLQEPERVPKKQRTPHRGLVPSPGPSRAPPLIHRGGAAGRCLLFHWSLL